MRIIDTHQHLWDLSLFPYTWCKGIPSLYRSFRMEDYLEATRGLDVEKSVHVEADVDEPYRLSVQNSPDPFERGMARNLVEIVSETVLLGPPTSDDSCERIVFLFGKLEDVSGFLQQVD